ncbi:hypothetical protein [Arthrobacter sp. GMC3]|uniref:hypothetical protein n=1 Tax=Arthrobacter sp. GMC3 TaxID=2058894 RepID=UPI000CE523C4|nr:hypothetical protein [Arthrobacter sp. GMC3]
MAKKQERDTLAFSYGTITAQPAPIPEVITPTTLAELAIPVARRLAFVRVALTFGVALLLISAGLLVSGYLDQGPGSAGAFGVLVTFGALILGTALACSWIFGAKKTLRRPSFIWPAKTPETVPDAWLGTGIMAAVSIVILILVAIFGGDSWGTKMTSVQAALPFATLGPGIIAVIFLITGYTMGNRDAIFQRWLRKRPLAAAEYDELRSRIQDQTAQP